VDFCTALQTEFGVHLLSTGGTAKKLREAGLHVQDVAEYTQASECLHGRVKTLHPKVHGALLAVRGNTDDEKDCQEQGIVPIDLTILNLYPFGETVAQYKDDEARCIENIDIGGPSMMRSTAKNHAFTTIVSCVDQYESVLAELRANQGQTTLSLRKQLAAQAFATSATYDAAIAEYMMSRQDTELPTTLRVYQPTATLKYGCNPHQKPARICQVNGNNLPFVTVNGTPGYINLLDAANAWQLVQELKEATGLAAAASFKHVSPAGAAVAVPLTETEQAAYEAPDNLTSVALAYVRARHADPLCSFGDFCAVSDEVDEATALVLKREVSDGICAPGYTPAALEILKQKKSGKYIILQATPNYTPPEVEYREVYGMGFMQKRNTAVLSKDDFQVVTQNQDLTDAAARDLLVASIAIKYTQSNSVGFSHNGMMVGVGAGQQSRVDCTKLAANKVKTWMLRQHPKVLGLEFKEGSKRQDRVNARVRYIEGDFTPEERVRWEAQFATVPEPLTDLEKQEFVATRSGICVSSDAFFPFRDSIDFASKVGVQYVAQPGGSVQDGQVTEACDEYKMCMVFTGTRLFHH